MISHGKQGWGLIEYQRSPGERRGEFVEKFTYTREGPGTNHAVGFRIEGRAEIIFSEGARA